MLFKLLKNISVTLAFLYRTTSQISFDPIGSIIVIGEEAMMRRLGGPSSQGIWSLGSSVVESLAKNVDLNVLIA